MAYLVVCVYPVGMAQISRGILKGLQMVREIPEGDCISESCTGHGEAQQDEVHRTLPSPQF